MGAGMWHYLGGTASTEVLHNVGRRNLNSWTTNLSLNFHLGRLLQLDQRHHVPSASDDGLGRPRRLTSPLEHGTT